MPGGPVAPGALHYGRDGDVATITIDDGKVNALTPAMFGGLAGLLDRAQAEARAVVLLGRPGVFSAGFDLGVLRAGGEDASALLRAGFELAARLASFPVPVVIGCTGHAIAMGAFLVLCGDYRIGADGPFTIRANEVAIGMTVPDAAIKICRARLSPAHLGRVLLLAERYEPAGAAAAGFLDEVRPDAEVAGAAKAAARRLCELDLPSHAATKLALRGELAAAVRAAAERDFGRPAPTAA